MVTVEQIIEHFGSKRALADLLDVSPQSLTRWNSDGVPPKAAIQIEKLTNGKFRAIQIPISGSAKNSDKAGHAEICESKGKAA